MQQQALIKANSRLRVARRAIEELRNCSDFERFTDLWYTFLVAAKNVYTALEQGSKSSSQWKQWFLSKAHERKNDELLQYIFQARDDDEHGLGSVAAPLPGSVSYGVNRQGFSNNITFSASGGRVTKIRSNDRLPIATEFEAPRIELTRVHNRNRHYDPPTRYKGNVVDGKNPYVCALAAFGHLKNW